MTAKTWARITAAVVVMVAVFSVPVVWVRWVAAAAMVALAGAPSSVLVAREMGGRDGLG